MNHDELVAKAIEGLRQIECHRPPPVGLDRMSKSRVRETAIVYFEGDEKEGRIEVCLDRDSGEFIEAKYIPPKRGSTSNDDRR